MFATAITAVVALLAQIAPTISTAGILGSVISTITSLAPVVIQTVPALYNQIKDIITTLRGNSQITPDQIAALDAAEAQIDADWDAIKAQVLAQDAAASA